jgi:hypothetical protein
VEERKSEDFAFKYEELVMITAGRIIDPLNNLGKFLLISIAHIDIHSPLKCLVKRKEIFLLDYFQIII